MDDCSPDRNTAVGMYGPPSVPIRAGMNWLKPLVVNLVASGSLCARSQKSQNEHSEAAASPTMAAHMAYPPTLTSAFGPSSHVLNCRAFARPCPEFFWCAPMPPIPRERTRCRAPSPSRRRLGGRGAAAALAHCTGTLLVREAVRVPTRCVALQPRHIFQFNYLKF